MDGNEEKKNPHPTNPARLWLRKLGRNTSGATAVEFGFIALPFISLLFAILEVSLVYFGNLALDNAVEETGRLVRTGQAQASSMSQADFKSNICSNVISLFDCQGKMQVELVTFDNFQAARDYAANSSNNPLNSDGDLRSDFTYETNSAPEKIVLLRVFLEWDLTLAFPGVGLSNMNNGHRLLSAVTTFKNEPFE